eukprot:scaffold62448_cov36-Tisochrysis_lutea.AAC.4
MPDEGRGAPVYDMTVPIEGTNDVKKTPPSSLVEYHDRGVDLCSAANRSVPTRRVGATAAIGPRGRGRFSRPKQWQAREMPANFASKVSLQPEHDTVGATRTQKAG